ncbi:MAG: DUF4936 family protein [Caldimonas sp.]
MRELFVWYRVVDARAAAARAAVQDMQQSLSVEVPGLRARLLVRKGEAKTAQTWMESYACSHGLAGISADIEVLIEARAQALAGFIEGTRHVEAFEVVGDG